MDDIKHTEELEGRKALLEIATHIAMVAAAFLMVFGIAIGLDLLIKYIENQGFIKTGSLIIWSLYTAKYVILLADFILLFTLTFRIIRRDVVKSIASQKDTSRSNVLPSSDRIDFSTLLPIAAGFGIVGGAIYGALGAFLGILIAILFGYWGHIKPDSPSKDNTSA